MSRWSVAPVDDVGALVERARALGLGDVQDDVMSWAKPSWWLGASGSGHVGFLGSPDRGALGAQWPTNEGVELTAIACLDLGALPALHEQTDLPPTGSMVFFADLRAHDPLLDRQDLPHNGGAVRVLVSEEVVPPGGDAVRLDAHPFLSLPIWQIAESLGLPDELIEPYETLWAQQGGMQADPPWTPLITTLGHPYWIQDGQDVGVSLLQYVHVRPGRDDQWLYFVAEPDDVLGTYRADVQF